MAFPLGIVVQTATEGHHALFGPRCHVDSGHMLPVYLPLAGLGAETERGEAVALCRRLAVLLTATGVQMTLPTTATLYTPEDLLMLPDYGRFELLDGHLVERKTGAQSSYAATNVIILMSGEEVIPAFQCQVAAVFQGL